MFRRAVVFATIVVGFFFQAEDGIRDLVRSRGLGDVYKRQVLATRLRSWVQQPRVQALRDESRLRLGRLMHKTAPVSYTHLTLPTSDLV